MSQLFRTPDNSQIPVMPKSSGTSVRRRRRAAAAFTTTTSRSPSLSPSDESLLSVSLTQLMEDATQKVRESPRTQTQTNRNHTQQQQQQQPPTQDNNGDERTEYSNYSVPSLSLTDESDEEARLATQAEDVRRVKVNYSSWLGSGFVSRASASRKK
eukprot:TRINITY_DN222_c2_g1_i1.p1 TRINITY_DN222_c2_g1~~TRINITY_DN222_c2_g1_i1.p1  ORF type:complete len:156 (-),score=32.28 TRINITY_DN222_c2_g1_i1:80-547(-)